MRVQPPNPMKKKLSLIVFFIFSLNHLFAQSVTLDSISGVKIFCSTALQQFSLTTHIKYTGVGSNRTLKFQIAKGPLGSANQDVFDACNQTSGFTVNHPSAISGTGTLSPVSFTFNASTFTQCGVYKTRVIICNNNTQIAVSTPVTTNQITIIQPVITPTTVCSGNTIGTCSTQGSGLSYLWSNSATTNVITPSASGTFTVTITDGNGASCSFNQAITVNSTPSVSVNPSSATLCNGQSTSLTASGATTYSWSPSSGLNTTTGTSVTASPTVTTTYTVTGTSSGCSSTATVVVTVNSSASISISPITAAFCSGGSINLTASGGNTYSWTPATGLSATTGATVTASPTSTTTYTVTGTTANGCSGTASKTVTVNPLPSVSVSPSTASICSGSSINLTASGASTYTWTPSTGLSATTGATVSANPSSTITYTVTGTTANGCTGTATKIVTVNPVPTISVSPATATICAGGSIPLTASGANTYSWSPSSGLSPTTGATVTASPASTTTYTVTGTAANGCTGNATRIVTVNPLPTVSISPATVSICIGASQSLTASGASTYTWTPSTGLSATNGSSVNASPVATTTYTVTGTSAAGCTSTATRIVTINPLPTVNVSPATVSICLGASATLTASGASTYTWTPSTGLNITTGTNVNASPSSTTTYTVTGTSAAGCTGTSTRIVTILPLPTVSVSPATVTICFGQGFSLTASGASSYTWTPSAGLSPSSGATVTANPTATSTYTVVGTAANSCTSSATRIVNVNPSLNSVTPVFPDTICSGVNSTVTLALLSTATYNYDWFFSSSQSGSISCNGTCSGNNVSSNLGGNTFTLNLTNATSAAQQAVIHYDPVLPSTAGGSEGCHKANGDTTFTIVVLPIPSFTAVPQKVNVCDNSVIAVDLIPQTTGTPAYKFDWTWENASDNSSNPSTVSNPALAIINATVQNLDDTKHVPISYSITPRFQVASPSSVCTGTPSSVTLQVMPTLSGNDTTYVRCEKSETGNIKVTSNESTTIESNTTYKWNRINSNNVLTSSLWTQDIKTSDYILPSIVPVLQSNSTTGTATYSVIPIYHLGSDSCEGSPINLSITFNPAPNEPVFTLEPSCIGQKNVYVFIQPSANTNYSWGNQLGLFNDDSTKAFIADPDLFGNSISLTASTNIFGNVKCSTTKLIPIPSQINSLPYADMFQLTVNPASMAVLYDVAGIEYQWHRVSKNLFNDNSSFALNSISFGLSPNQNQSVYVFGNEILNTNDNYYYVDYKTSGNACIQRSFLNNVSNVTSTRDDLLKNFFKVYPNPSSDYIVVEMPYIAGEAFIHVVDLSGRTIINKQVFKPLESIDTSQLDDGLYILTYQSGSGLILTQKLMIAR